MNQASYIHPKNKNDVLAKQTQNVDIENEHRKEKRMAQIEDATKINGKLTVPKIRIHNANDKPKAYKLDDLVLTKTEPAITGESRQIKCRYKGPFIVTSVLGNGRYVIEDLPSSKRKQRHYKSVYAADLLKSWCELPVDIEPDGESETENDSEDAYSQEGPTVNTPATAESSRVERV